MYVLLGPKLTEIETVKVGAFDYAIFYYQFLIGAKITLRLKGLLS